ncbi:MAG: hypothetical protein M5R36_18220 [Deltaproteobacteria bacterium]|nr:hypothetical protein [Deltaproteobacteria bacterium]
MYLDGGALVADCGVDRHRLFLDDVHLTVQGSDCLGRRLAETLVSRNLIGRAGR